jgi:Peptidase propeptide and YPEB domain
MSASTTKSFAAAARFARGLRRSARRAAGAFALGLGLLGAATARAQPNPFPGPRHDDESPSAFMAQRGGRISLQQATAIALSRYQGRVVRAEPTSRGDRIVYEIRILGEDGRVRTVRIDAETGQFL